MILYAFDFNTFKENMGVYDELWDAIPGEKVFTFPHLLEALSVDLLTYQKDIEAARKKIFTFNDAGATKRITDFLLENQ